MKKTLLFLLFLVINLNPNTSAAHEKLIVLTFDDGPRPKVLLGAEEKLIVLTFDGGPKPEVLLDTKEKAGLIEVLKSFRVPAHFFMVGKKIEARADAVSIVSQNGFLVENHSYGHENLVELLKKEGKDALLKNVMRTSEAILRATGRRPKYFRPPFWTTNKNVEALIESIGLKVVVGPGRPDVNTLDYDDYDKKRPPEALIKRMKKIIAAREKKGIYKHVLVFHELPNTVEALKVLIPYFLERGYSFGTLDDFFAK